MANKLTRGEFTVALQNWESVALLAVFRVAEGFHFSMEALTRH